MGIYKRGKTFWIDYFDRNRKRVQESSHSSIRRDAEQLYALRKAEVLRGVYKRPIKIAFGDFSKRYMEYAKANKRSWLRDEQMLKPLTEHFSSERPLTEILPVDIEGYKLHRRAQVSGSTVNRELALLKRMFNLAIEWDLFLDRNPVCRVRFFKEFNIHRRTLSIDEEEKLLRNAAPFLQDLITFALNTGLRVGELFSLQWSSVDLEQDVLNVYASKTGKTRPIPVNSESRRILEAWALGRKNDFVFYNHDTGRPFVDLKAGFALACRKAGISDVTWHTLRHTFASRLVERGVDIVTVQQLLGHSTVTVTMRYTHTNLASKKSAIEKLPGHCDKSVTVCTTMQQSKPKVSHSRVVSYNVSRT
jgi:integrase